MADRIPCVYGLAILPKHLPFVHSVQHRVARQVGGYGELPNVADAGRIVLEIGLGDD